MQPLEPRVPSLFGHDIPPERDSLYTLQPNLFRMAVLKVFIYTEHHIPFIIYSDETLLSLNGLYYAVCKYANR